MYGPRFMCFMDLKTKEGNTEEGDEYIKKKKNNFKIKTNDQLTFNDFSFVFNFSQRASIVANKIKIKHNVIKRRRKKIQIHTYIYTKKK